jgi:hypothetical protein
VGYIPSLPLLFDSRMFLITDSVYPNIPVAGRHTLDDLEGVTLTSTGSATAQLLSDTAHTAASTLRGRSCSCSAVADNQNSLCCFQVEFGASWRTLARSCGQGGVAVVVAPPTTRCSLLLCSTLLLLRSLLHSHAGRRKKANASEL